MRRELLPAAIVLAFVGCQTSADQRRPVQPLPAADGPALSYRDVVSRARILATQATEAFYIDQWTDVERAALNLEETARYLPKSVDVPSGLRPGLDGRSKTLEEQSLALRDAAKARDEKKTNDVMQRVNLLVRELRSE
jgi:hypothetical protein